MEELTGYVEHIVFRNAENGYTVMNFAGEKDEMTCVGTFSVISEGMYLKLRGEYVDHPTYGVQMKVESFEEQAPEDIQSIERYLGSGAIKGIGAALAARIVRRFKEDTFSDHPGRTGTFSRDQGDQREKSDGDLKSGGRKKRTPSGNDLFAKIRNIH